MRRNGEREAGWPTLSVVRYRCYRPEQVDEIMRTDCTFSFCALDDDAELDGLVLELELLVPEAVLPVEDEPMRLELLESSVPVTSIS